MKYRSSCTTVEVLKEETRSASQLQHDVDSLRKSVEEKKGQIEQLKIQVAREMESHPEQLVNRGHNIDDVCARQKRRKLSQLKTTAQKVLWFSETFGL